MKNNLRIHNYVLFVIYHVINEMQLVETFLLIFKVKFSNGVDGDVVVSKMTTLLKNRLIRFLSRLNAIRPSQQFSLMLGRFSCIENQY